MKETTTLLDKAYGHRVFEKNGKKFTILKILNKDITEDALLREVQEILDKAT